METEITITSEKFDEIIYSIHGIYRRYFSEIIGNDFYKLDQMDEIVYADLGLKYVSYAYEEHLIYLLHLQIIDKNKFLMAKIIHGI
jgi:hypothetical protein